MGYVLLDFIKITEKEMLENDLYRPITDLLINSSLFTILYK
ncbi:hypothetical protein [Clostridium ihumii]|nr:hypothetical protein [Clostridium ihumii]